MNLEYGLAVPPWKHHAVERIRLRGKIPIGRNLFAIGGSQRNSAGLEEVQTTMVMGESQTCLLVTGVRVSPGLKGRFNAGQHGQTVDGEGLCILTSPVLLIAGTPLSFVVEEMEGGIAEVEIDVVGFELAERAWAEAKAKASMYGVVVG